MSGDGSQPATVCLAKARLGPPCSPADLKSRFFGGRARTTADRERKRTKETRNVGGGMERNVSCESTRTTRVVFLDSVADKIGTPRQGISGAHFRPRLTVLYLVTRQQIVPVLAEFRNWTGWSLVQAQLPQGSIGARRARGPLLSRLRKPRDTFWCWGFSLEPGNCR